MCSKERGVLYRDCSWSWLPFVGGHLTTASLRTRGKEGRAMILSFVKLTTRLGNWDNMMARPAGAWSCPAIRLGRGGAQKKVLRGDLFDEANVI